MAALLAKSEADAAELIATLVKECRDDVSDREVEAVSLAGLWTLDVDRVREGFASARKLRAEVKAPPTVPKAEGGIKQRKVFDGPPKSEVKERLGVGLPEIQAALQVSGKAMPEPERKAAPFFSPATQPQVGGNASALHDQAVAVPSPSFATPKRKERIELPPLEVLQVPAEVVLDRAAPRDTAKKFAQTCCVTGGALTTWYWDGRFWQWNGCFYEAIGDDQLIDKIWKFLDEAKVGAERNRFRPRPRDVDEVLKALRSAISIDPKMLPPAWIGSDEPDRDPRNLLVFRNSLVEIQTGDVLPLTPALWTHDGAGYDYDPGGRCERWEQFLAEVFPGDPESQDTLEEMLGYGMTYDTKFEKGFLLVGVKRSGKSTVAWILKKLVGDQAYIGLSFNTLTRGENSVAEIVDKKVAVFSDARFRQARMFGASYDPGGIGHAAAELLLNVIGRDTISLGRKYKSKWIGQLPTKIVITSNEVPNLRDASGVLPTRFIKLEFKQSFYGHEDIELRDKLSSELPGIANRCLTALRNLNERGRFIQPKAGKELEQAIENLTNPFAAFMHEKWERDDASEGPTMDMLYSSFKRWAEDNGRIDLCRSVPQNKLISYITAMDEWSWLRAYRPHGEKRRYPGLRRKARDGE